MSRRIAVLAQDLIWQERLARAVEAAGAEPVRAKTAPEFDRALVCADLAIIDLTARGYDPLVAIERAVAGAHVLAVGQHDDLDCASGAGAGRRRVLAYRKLFEDGRRRSRRGWTTAAASCAYRKLFEDGPRTIAAFVERTTPVGS